MKVEYPHTVSCDHHARMFFLYCTNPPYRLANRCPGPSRAFTVRKQLMEEQQLSEYTATACSIEEVGR